jgi:hypothetical protein
VGLERGPLSLTSTIEVIDSSLETEIMAVGDPPH